MRLTRVELEGYRSIKKTLSLHIDRKATVLLGANDHGKSNVLASLQHLNADKPFEEDQDLNWDFTGRESEFPRVLFEFELTEEEKSAIQDAENHARWETFTEEAGEIARSQHESALEQQILAEQRLAASLETQANADSSLEAAIAERNANSSNADLKQAVVAARTAARTAKRDQKRATGDLEKAKEAVQLTEARFRRVQIHQLEEAAIQAGEPPEYARNSRLKAARTKLAEMQEEMTASQEASSQAQLKLQATMASGNTKARELAENRASAAALVVKTFESAFTEQQLIIERIAGLTTADLESSSSAPSIFGLEAIKDMRLGEEVTLFTPETTPNFVQFQRLGLTGDLDIIQPEGLRGRFEPLLRQWLPRVELIRPVATLPDHMTLAELEEDNMGAWFMRGIFYYAGLERAEWPSLFAQSLLTSRKLREAGKRLDATLKENWAQGRELEFRLIQDSVEERINLQLADPTVSETDVWVSKRSSGFTHFFSLKTIMFAREQEANASNYIWLFDEPGVYLHPDGQHDLLQVIETLSQAHQVIYSTHSLFMLNKNHPIRHRLIYKSESGTKIDEKPYRTRWRPAMHAIGLSLPGTVLFASNVLLVEGDSDPIFINTILQVLSERGDIDRDLNSFAAIATTESKNADALVRILSESEPIPKMAFLFDNDRGGRERGDRTKELARNHSIPIIFLPDKNSTIEDYLPGGDQKFVKAAAKYVSKLSGKDENELEAQLLESAKCAQEHSMVEEVLLAAKAAADLDEKPSKLGIAREYALLMEEKGDYGCLAPGSLARARQFAECIFADLPLDTQTLTQDRIVQDS